MHDYMIDIAAVVATRSTCPRRQVGCVAVDANKRIVATGYNGVPRGFPHCTEFPCGGEKSASGTNLDGCHATHAEMNCLLHAPDAFNIQALYVTTFPCFSCAKLIANTSVKTIYYRDSYPSPTANALFDKLGIKCLKVK